MTWVNVDKPERDCCIHDDLNCRYVLGNSAGTPLKGSGQMLDDGGWRQLPSVAAAQAYTAATWPNFRTHQHC